MKITTLPFIYYFLSSCTLLSGLHISDITWRQQYATPPEPLWRRGARQTVAYSSSVSSHQVWWLWTDRNRRLWQLWGTEEEQGDGFSQTETSLIWAMLAKEYLSRPARIYVKWSLERQREITQPVWWVALSEIRRHGFMVLSLKEVKN